MSQEKKNGNIIAIIAMCFLFAMISFVTNLAAPIGNVWKAQGLSNMEAMLGNFMNFFAYLFMGIPAGKMLESIGYKKTALTAMVVGIVGLFVQYMGGQVDPSMGFAVYLLGAFICGFCVCMLNTVVNPMLNLLGGGGNKGNQLIQIGGSLNSLAGTLTPLFVGMLIGTITDQTKLGDVSSLLFVAMGVFAVAFVIIFLTAIPEPHLKKGGEAKVKDPHSAWSFRHFVMGAVAIALYVGVETGIPGTLNLWLADPEVGLGREGAAAIAGGLAGFYWLLMMFGRITSSAISGAVSSKMQLTVCATVAIIFILLAIFLPDSITVSAPAFANFQFTMESVPASALFLVLCGCCTSVMWGGIFNLAVEGLGKYTASASGIFMMMVFGGGILPLIQNFVADKAGFPISYVVPLLAVAYILYYALIGCKNVNKDIPVE
ncbi:MAG: MFS transporter [Bacteroidales bacterium]|nr:MFS transporter [Bacteroidales bacterium]